MNRTYQTAAFCLGSLSIATAAGCAPPPRVADPATLGHEVESVERAFAATMAKRDFAGFTSFLSEEAVFVSGGKAARGKAQVLARWKRFYDGADAPFSWEPDHVSVLDAGTLALSTGPVRDRKGHVVARFMSVWRHEESGWRIVLDQGVDMPTCPPEPAKAP